MLEKKSDGFEPDRVAQRFELSSRYLSTYAIYLNGNEIVQQPPADPSIAPF